MNIVAGLDSFQQGQSSTAGFYKLVGAMLAAINVLPQPNFDAHHEAWPLLSLGRSTTSEAVSTAQFLTAKPADADLLLLQAMGEVYDALARSQVEFNPEVSTLLRANLWDLYE